MMMDDNEIMDVIRKASRLAGTHACVPWCPGDYAGGNPRYWDRLVRLAASLGYGMRHDWHPVEAHGEGIQGHTVGYVPVNLLGETEPRHICIIPGMAPGTDFFVSVHELTHAFLRHPAQDLTDLLAKAGRDGTDYGHEIACHLSGVAVCEALGIPVRQGAICYLSDKVRGGRKPVQEKDQYAAFQAARMITEAIR
jgi:hypothetical protein